MSCYLNDVQYLQNVAFSFEKAQKLKIVPPQIPTTLSKKSPQQNFPFPPILGEFPLMPFKMLVSGPQNVGKILDLSAGLSLLLPYQLNLQVCKNISLGLLSPVLIFKYARICGTIGFQNFTIPQNASQLFFSIISKGSIYAIPWLPSLLQLQRSLYI